MYPDHEPDRDRILAALSGLLLALIPYTAKYCLDFYLFLYSEAKSDHVAQAGVEPDIACHSVRNGGIASVYPHMPQMLRFQVPGMMLTFVW